MAKRAVGRPWSQTEDHQLATAVAVHGQVDNWKAVALAVPGRSNKACRKRWLHSLSPDVKKSAWTKDEDNLLLDLYKIHAAKWAVIARNIPGRTDDACSKRYREALDPSLKKDDWTPDEDRRLLAAHARLGGKWGLVGQELQRSGLGCRNRWRLFERKRLTASPPEKHSQQDSFWSLPMTAFWDQSRNSFADPQPQLDYPSPFHYSSSLMSSHAIHYEKCPDNTASDHALVLPPPPPPNNSSTPVFAPFDYDSSSSSLSVGSTSPAPQPPYPDDMHQTSVYNDRHHQFHQLQPTLSHTAMPVHSPSAHPVHVDHYTSVPHNQCIPHAALPTRHQPTPPASSLHAQNSADSFFAPSQLPDRQATHMPSSMTSPSLLDNPDAYYHPSPDPALDVNPQHSLLTPDPLSLPEPRPAYHYAHHRDTSRPRVVETLHGREQHADYYHNHAHPDQAQPSTPPTTSPPESRYALQPDPNVHTPEPGDHYYSATPIISSHLVRRPTASPRAVQMPYPKRSPSTNSEDYQPLSVHPAPKRKIGPITARKRPDSQAPLRLSSDLQATSDPSIKPYACGHESCWPSSAASSRACYCTSRGLSDHNKSAHPEDSGGDRPYRCGLEGCGKSWKSINGLQYHLQISKAHFQHAISTSFVSSYVSGLALPASGGASTSTEGEDRTKRQYQCPHANCPNRYKQLSGLRYHLAHGHPVDLPKQLDLVPPALSRKLVEKMRGQAVGSSSNVLDTTSLHSAQGSFNS